MATDGEGMTVRFSQDVADRICADLEKGMTLRAVCRQDGMPAPSTVLDWADHDRGPGFGEQYARARERGYQAMADELLEIADDGTNDYVKREMERGVEVLVDHDHVNRSRLRLDTRKWLLARALPKIYGDKMQNQQLDKDGNPVDLAQPIINVTVAK